MVPSIQQKHLMHEVVVPMMNFHILWDRADSPFYEATHIFNMVSNNLLGTFV